MDLKQLKALIAVDDHGSFSAAADALDTVQSNVSAHISKIEGELNAVLIDRRTGALTDSGRTVVTRARNAVAEVEAIFTDLSSLTTDVKGKIRVGLIGTVARWLIPLISPELSRNHPQLHVEMLEGTTTSLLRWLGDGVIDLAVMNSPTSSADIVYRTIFSEVMVLTVPKGSVYSHRHSIEVRELATLELIVPPKGNWFRDELDAVAAKHQVKIRPKVEIDGLRLAAALSIEGFGSAVVPVSAVPGHTYEQIDIIPISDMAPRKVGIARKRNSIESAASKAFSLLLDRVVTSGRNLPEGVSPR